MAMNPTANAAQLVAPKISLLVTAAAPAQGFVMPSFVGQPLGSVSRTLQDAGFRLGNVSVAAIVESPVEQSNPAQQAGAPTPPAPPAQATPASIIVSQVPAAGQKVAAGMAVSFEVR